MKYLPVSSGDNGPQFGEARGDPGTETEQCAAVARVSRKTHFTAAEHPPSMAVMGSSCAIAT